MTKSLATTYAVMNSPVGKLYLLTSVKGLHAILWDNQEHDLNHLRHDPQDKFFLLAKQQLLEYFQAERKKFDLPLLPEGTSFQLQVWQQLRKIPYGKTISYGEQAERIGDKNKARAVGVANGRNPLSIIVPCHRVIGSNGKLVGFGGGLDKKEFLLELERSKV